MGKLKGLHRMNKAIWIFFGLLVVATGALTYHFLSPPDADTTAPVSAKHQPPPSLLGTGAKKSTAPAPAIREGRPVDRPAVSSAMDSPAMQEVRKKLAETQSRISPEMRQRMVDSIMRMREPRYRQLFDSWNLDPASADDVLRILRDRETSHSELRAKIFGDPSSDIAALSGQTKAMSADAEARLLPVLGQDRLMELAQEEERMKAESIARAKEQMERYKN
jgi:hypothetical protein